MTVKKEEIRQLRDKTGAGIMECKGALIEAGGDVAKAVEVLRKKGVALAKKKSGRTAKEGGIFSYVHPGDKLAVMIEINCESDFVARTSEFKELAKNIAMQIAASNPSYISKEDVPEEERNKEAEIIKAQIKDKPDKVVEKIVLGKLEKFYQEACLLEQPYVREPKTSVKDYIDSVIGTIGENIVVRRFVRYELGEEIQ